MELSVSRVDAGPRRALHRELVLKSELAAVIDSLVGQLRGEVLLVQPLLAELVEFDFPGEVSSDQFLDFVADRGLEVVLVDLLQKVHFVEVDIRGTGEELGHVPFQHGEGRVEVFEHSDDGVLAFDGILGTLQGSLAVEGTVE